MVTYFGEIGACLFAVIVRDAGVQMVYLAGQPEYRVCLCPQHRDHEQAELVRRGVDSLVWFGDVAHDASERAEVRRVLGGFQQLSDFVVQRHKESVSRITYTVKG